MKYSRFELLALSVGSLSVAWAILSTWRNGPLLEECFAQALFMVVLVAAVHWGRKAGMVTAIIAMLAYGAFRAPLLVREGFSADAIGLVLVRTLTYGVVGIAGGALCSRVRYLLARLDGNSNMDEVTGLFNQRFVTEMLRSMIGQHERYHKPFSIVLLSVEKASGGSGVPNRSVLRRVAAQIRGDLRLVDDVARLDDGRFLLVLPHTEKAGAHIAADRVRSGVNRLLRADGPMAEIEVLGTEGDLSAISALCGAAADDERNPARTRAAA